MCNKFVLVSDSEIIGSRFRTTSHKSEPFVAPSYAVGCGDATYVITAESPYELQAIQFGMTPYMAKAPMNLINARAEGDKNASNDPNYRGPNQIFLKKAFMKPIQSQRCLVLADAYYEWSAAKKPYVVYLQNKERPFAFAGIYDRWENPGTGEILTSFAIITTTANSMLQSLGVKRMPVILSKGEERDWLKDTLPLAWVLKMLKPLDPRKMNAYPVADIINSMQANNPDMIRPIGERLQSEANLLSRDAYFKKQNHRKYVEPGPPLGERKIPGQSPDI
ncbi:MAG TPA: SOS response-associated peptidase [Prolixibacteraceae bacterium]|nr:SOS response-associated peptidase [Prolixibacteraceae bacterium]